MLGLYRGSGEGVNDLGCKVKKRKAPKITVAWADLPRHRSLVLTKEKQLAAI
jgi:hypothetical protein